MFAKSFVIAAALGAVGVPAAANAQRWQPIAQRKVNLSARIDQGIRSGELNRREASRLIGQLDSLVVLERQYRASGRILTARERRELDRRYDVLSRRVYRQKNDAQGRY